MTRIDVEGRVCVRLDVDDEVADQLTENDLMEMAQAAVNHSEMRQVVQLIVKSKAQWEPAGPTGHDKIKVEIPIHVELDNCDEIGRDKPYEGMDA